MEFLSLNAKINQVIGSGFGNSQDLSSPVNYNRIVLFPDSEYFIIIDRMEGTESWVYSNIFRPTSLNIIPTVDKNKDGEYAESEVGHVNGSLTVGTTPVDWQALSFKKETDTGITTNTLEWTTVNPYGKYVKLNIISEPASDIKVTKLVGRIAGYDAPSEVFSPVVWFTPPASQNLYRITALLSRYPDEESKSGENIAVQGTGNALKIHLSGHDDIIYTGSGISSFDQFSTNADVAFIRRQGENTEVTIIDGSFLKYQGVDWINLSKKADFVTVKKNGESLDYRVQADPDLRGELFNGQMDPLKIQNRTVATVQKNIPVSPGTSGTNAGNSFDLISFLKKIVKQILSFFNIKAGLRLFPSI